MQNWRLFDNEKQKKIGVIDMNSLHNTHLHILPSSNGGRRHLPQDHKYSPRSERSRHLRKNLQKYQKHELEKACSEFASLFSYMLIKNLRTTIPKSSLLQENQGKKLLNDMVDQKVAQHISSQNGFGIKELLLKTFRAKNINRIK